MTFLVKQNHECNAIMSAMYNFVVVAEIEELSTRNNLTVKDFTFNYQDIIMANFGAVNLVLKSHF